jgi:Dockerin type I domain
MSHKLASRLAAIVTSTACVLVSAGSVQAGASWTLEQEQNGSSVVVYTDGTNVEYFTPGDVLFNGNVNAQDIALIASNWLSTQTPSAGGSSLPGDANGDGIVNFQDLELVASNWGQSGGDIGSLGAQAHVPEPSTGLVFGIWALGMWLIRRRVRS